MFLCKRLLKSFGVNLVHSEADRNCITFILLIEDLRNFVDLGDDRILILTKSYCLLGYVSIEYVDDAFFK